MAFPDDNQTEEKIRESLMYGIFNVTNVKSKKFKSVLDSDSITFDNLNNTLIYSESNIE